MGGSGRERQRGKEERKKGKKKMSEDTKEWMNKITKTTNHVNSVGLKGSGCVKASHDIKHKSFSGSDSNQKSIQQQPMISLRQWWELWAQWGASSVFSEASPCSCLKHHME